MSRESYRPKRSVIRDKIIECRHVEIERVRDNLYSSKLYFPRLGSLGNRCSFHVNRDCTVCFGETNFLLLIRHTRGTYQRSLAQPDFCPHTIGGVDHNSWRENISNLHRPIKSSRKTN